MENTDNRHIINLRENYTVIVLLLFYTYRTKEDLELEGSYWNRYQHALAENKISPKCLEVLQNIQDVCHNCSKLKSACDEIESSTVYESHENDQREQSPEDKLNLVSFDEISELFQQADDYGIRDVHASKRRLDIISKRHEIVEQKIPVSEFMNFDITEIPEGFALCENMSKKKKTNIYNDENNSSASATKMTSVMIIQILNDNIIQGLPLDEQSNIKASTQKRKIISLQDTISEYTLDFKQSVAFEVMASSFILNSLQLHNITQKSIEMYFKANETQKCECINSLSQLKKSMKKKGGTEDLVMFLSGMGGTGKSEVIKAFVMFVTNISHLFNWNYDSDTIKITALTGSAACQIPNGRTLHSQACLNTKKIGQAAVDSWKSTKMLIIDEVSFLNEDTLEKLDKKMRLLKECDVMFGGVNIVFVGDFFQMLPVKGKALFKCNTLQFCSINRAVFLNVSHRFKEDPKYGEIMRRFRIGKATKNDIQTINSRHIENANVILPPITKLRCACYKNVERNAYSNAIFFEHLKQTHQKTEDTSVECPMHTCIIKASMRSNKDEKN